MLKEIKINARGDKFYEKVQDRAGNLLSETFYMPDGTVREKTVNGHDDRGNVTLTRRYNYGDKLSSTYIKKYDEKNNLIVIKEYGSEGNMRSRTVKTYDEQGNEIHTKRFDSQNRELFSTKYLYDERGNYKEIQRFDNKGNNVGETDYTTEYDEYGNWIRKTRYEEGLIGFIIERSIEYFPESGD